MKMTIWRKYEPTLGELLTDSGTRALMHADGVKRSEIEALLKRIGRTRVADADRKPFGTLAPRRFDVVEKWRSTFRNVFEFF
jgi:hypothetical protein